MTAKWRCGGCNSICEEAEALVENGIKICPDKLCGEILVPLLCRGCDHCLMKFDPAGFHTYFCDKDHKGEAYGIVVGETDDAWFAKACDDFQDSSV